jgi:hypothetical protein
MNLNYNNGYELNLSENWGWYIDTESYLLPINNFEQKGVICKFSQNKKLNAHLNKMDNILEEDNEFDYYIKNNKDITIYTCLYKEKDNKKLFYTNKLTKFVFTIFIIVSLTYYIFIIL